MPQPSRLDLVVQRLRALHTSRSANAKAASEALAKANASERADVKEEANEAADAAQEKLREIGRAVDDVIASLDPPRTVGIAPADSGRISDSPQQMLSVPRAEADTYARAALRAAAEGATAPVRPAEGGAAFAQELDRIAAIAETEFPRVLRDSWRS